jgi:hypothetical protein
MSSRIGNRGSSLFSLLDCTILFPLNALLRAAYPDVDELPGIVPPVEIANVFYLHLEGRPLPPLIAWEPHPDIRPEGYIEFVLNGDRDPNDGFAVGARPFVRQFNAHDRALLENVFAETDPILEDLAVFDGWPPTRDTRRVRRVCAMVRERLALFRAMMAE